MAQHVTPPGNNGFTITEDLTQDWIQLDTFASEIEASIIKGALENERIPTMMTNQTFSRVYPIGFNSLGGVSLWVPSDMSEKALEVLRRNRDLND